MRDYLNSVSHVATHYKSVRELSSAPEKITADTTATGSYRTRWRGRADILKGDHQSPLSYFAFDCSARAHPISRREETAWQWKYVWPYGYTWERFVYTKSGTVGWNSTYTNRGLEPDGSPIVSPNLVNKARLRAMEKLSESDVNLGQTLGEMQSTVGLLTVNMAAGVAALRAVRNGNHRLALKHLGIRKGKIRQDVANKYLEYQFGWRPLMNDIYNGISAIQAAFSKKKVMRVSGTAVGAFPLLGVYPISYSGSLTQGTQVGYRYALSHPMLAGLDQLGLLNPLALGWELVPLSFVVDWFLSVGPVLRTLTVPLHYVYLSGYQTDFVKGSYSVTKTEPFVLATYNQHKLDCSVFGMKRNAIFSPPIPALSYSTGLNPSQILTSLALLNRK